MSVAWDLRLAREARATPLWHLWLPHALDGSELSTGFQGWRHPCYRRAHAKSGAGCRP